jgi:hypothetical protein
MDRFLFIFGYESPAEWAYNFQHGTDDESSSAVWVHADNSQTAIELGCQYAEKFVSALFFGSSIQDFQGWRSGNYAYGIEASPSDKFSQESLHDLPEINDGHNNEVVVTAKPPHT